MLADDLAQTAGVDLARQKKPLQPFTNLLPASSGRTPLRPSAIVSLTAHDAEARTAEARTAVARTAEARTAEARTTAQLDSMAAPKRRCAHASSLSVAWCRPFQLSDDYDLAVVVTNEATDKPIEQIAAAAGDIAAPSLQSLSLVSCNRPSVTVSPIEAKACCTSGKMTLPALGLSWSSCINTRLFLTRREVYAPTPLARTAFQPLSSGACQRLPSPLRDAGAQAYASALSRVAHDAARWHDVPPLELTLDAGCRQTRVARTLHVLFSPRLPSGSCDFEILQEGVRGVDDGTRA